MIFGLRSSPAILGATIRFYLALNAEEKSEVEEILKDSLYVDDLVSGARNDEVGFELYKNSKELMSKGGFNLRKWNSNSKELLEVINKEEGVHDMSCSAEKPFVQDGSSYVKSAIAKEAKATESTHVKLLGVVWDTIIDMLMFNFSEVIEFARALPLRSGRC